MRGFKDIFTMMKELTSDYSTHSKDFGREVAVWAFRKLVPGYSCTPCGPRYAGDSLLEWLCAYYAGKSLIPGFSVVMFPPPDRTTQHWETMVGRVLSHKFFDKGGRGGYYRRDAGNPLPSPRTTAGLVQYYNYETV